MRPERMLVVAGCLMLLLWLFFAALIGLNTISLGAPVLAVALIYAGLVCERAQKFLGGLDHQALRALAAAAGDAARPDTEGQDSDAQPFSRLDHSQRRFVFRHLRFCLFMTDKKGLWAARLFLAWPLCVLSELLLRLFLYPSYPDHIALKILSLLGSSLGELGVLLAVISYMGQPTCIAAQEKADSAERGQSLRRARLIFFCLALALFACAATALQDMLFSEEAVSIYYIAFRAGLPFCAGLWLVLNTIRGFRLQQTIGHPSYRELRALHTQRKGAPGKEIPDAKASAPEIGVKERGLPARDIRAATWMMDKKNLAGAVCLIFFLILHLSGVSGLEPDNASSLARFFLGLAAVWFIAGLVDIL